MFKVEVMACNGTGSITLLMWDRKMAFDGDGYPPALETMMDKKLLFKDNGCSDSINVSAVLANMQNDTDSIFSMDGIEDSVTSLKEKIPVKRATMGMKQSFAYKC
ncbi:hypothetical protein AHAS_Ahas13G0442700 [Arachis hypogaea]